MDTKTLKQLDRAIVLMGGLAESVRRLKVKQHSTIQSWRRTRVPAAYCPLIELETAGQVKCEQLRPDIAWHVLTDRKAA